MRRNIRLLGPLSITNAEQPSDLLRNAKGSALLVYLLVRGRSETREHLADLLWDASDTFASLRNLRVLLTRVRPLLPGLIVTRTSVQYAPGPEETIDYLRLVEALSLKNTNLTLDALRLYRGELFEGIYIEDAPRFMEWLTLERERLRRSVLAAHHRLCKTLADEHRWREGGEAASDWLAIDPLDEQAIRWQMQFMAASGRVSSALKAYENYKKELLDRFGIEPDESTQTLAGELEASGGEATAFFPIDLDSIEALNSPELSEPGSLPSNSILPYQRNDDFVGRESTLLQVAYALGKPPESGRSPAVAITGIGGMGKTQTAVEFCYRYGRYFPGGVFWLNFGEKENVAGEVAAIGSERGLSLFRETERLSLADQVGRVQRALQDPTPRLLIFDNCEDESLLKAWLPTSGGSRVLLTSRRAEWPRVLNLTCLPLDVLHRSESLHLLQSLAPNLEQDDADEIAAEVGDLPLAIHLAGGFLQHYKKVSAATYLNQLRDERLIEHPSLQGSGVRHSPTGHELHVARTFAVSLDELNPDDTVDAMAWRLLTHAACFAPGEPLSLDILRATIVQGDFMMTLLVEDGLMRLVSLGLLEREGGESVVLHRLLAAFVMEQMEAKAMLDDARSAVEDAMGRWLTSHLERARYAGVPPVRIPHLRYVTDMALERSSNSAALLTLALGRHLRVIGEYASTQRYLESGLAAAVANGDVYTQGRILAVLARVYFSQGFHQEADRIASEAERYLRQADVQNQEWLIDTLTRQGWAQLRLGQTEAALAAAEEAQQLASQVNDKSLLANYLNLLGSIQYYLLGNYEAADRYYEEARLLFRQAGDLSGEASILMNQGDSASMQGDYARAVALVKDALEVVREAGDQMRELSILINLSEAQLRLGDYDPAVTHLNHVTSQAPKDWTYSPYAYQVLAEGYLGQGKVGQALDAIHAAGSLESTDDPHNTAGSWRVLAHIAARLGQPVAPSATSDITYTSADCFARSLKIYTDIDHKREMAVVLWEWAKYEMNQGNKKRGKAMWQEARDIFTRLNLPLMIAWMEAVTHEE